MYGSAIPRVMSKHPGPQPPPEISYYDCAGAGVNCTQKKAWRPLDGDLESSGFMIKGGPGGGSLDGQIPSRRQSGSVPSINTLAPRLGPPRTLLVHQRSLRR